MLIHGIVYQDQSLQQKPLIVLKIGLTSSAIIRNLYLIIRQNSPELITEVI